ncbi:MAG: OmpA family protein [Gemmatimonadota bacterium]
MRTFKSFAGNLAMIPLLLASGCVMKGTHQRTVDELASTRTRQEEFSGEMERELQRREEREIRLRAQLDDRQREIDALIEQAGNARRETIRAQEQLAEARTESQRARDLLNAQGVEAQRLRGRLDQLSAIEAEIRERNRIYEEVLGRFRSLIDAGRLSVSIVRGRMVINLPQDILFASGSATLGREGRETLSQIATVLGDFDGRSFQVEGHTDNVPISTTQFPSNWELSAARALSVVKLLVTEGVPPDNVSGAGYGEYHPVATNQTTEGRRLNRRIEIVMLPNLNVIAETGLGSHEPISPTRS